MIFNNAAAGVAALHGARVRARIALNGFAKPFAGQQPRRFAFTAAGDETSVAMHLEHHGFGA